MKLLQDIQNNQVQKVKISRVQEVQEVQEAQEAQEAQEVQKVQKGGPKGRTRFVDREANRDDNKLTLKEAGGVQIDPMGFRLAAISHRIMLWSQKFLTLSINILSWG